MTDTTPAAVERFDPYATYGGIATMCRSSDGDYVSHSDYAALSAQLEAANDGWKESIDLTRLARQQYSDAKYQLATAHAKGKADGLREAIIIAESFAGGFKRALVKKASAAEIMNNLVSITKARTAYEIADTILAIIPADTPAAKVTLADLRPIWKAHGGDWHGPKVERWSIPEANMTAFFNDALRAIAGGRDE